MEKIKSIFDAVVDFSIKVFVVILGVAFVGLLFWLDRIRFVY
jgi:hypothetical protein